MNQAQLYKREDMEHFFVAVPDQHWTKGMDELPLESWAYAPVPQNTHFTKTPNWQSINKKEEMITCLRNQKEYWEKQIAGEIANELNDADKMSGGGDIDKHDRYKQRVKACSIFLQALQENPSIEDQRIFHGDKVDAEEWITADNPSLSKQNRQTEENN